ncbi:MAG: hypothetical protein WCE44_14660 [Candidatus Velthaea sp.]
MPILLATITQSGLSNVNSVIAAIVVLFATIYGGRSMVGIAAAGADFAKTRGDWEQAKDKFFGGAIGLALAALVGTTAFNLGGVGALF